MTGFPGRFRRRLLGISEAETTVSRRGFAVDSAAARDRLEQVGTTFLEGYHVALETPDPGALASRLDRIDAERRGWAYEGAAMALALLDGLLPWGHGRCVRLLDGAGQAHRYMVHVGAGWAVARLHRDVERWRRRFDPLLGWLLVDGYGFHEGFFHWARFVERKETPARLSGYARRVFDQGLGRSLWFVKGADAERIADTVIGFDESRRGDLWSGIGLACAYAGAVEDESVDALRALAGVYAPHVAQGAAFAAKARSHAQNPAPHTEQACRILCGCSAEAAAAVTDQALPDSPGSAGSPPAYERWREAIQRRFATLEVAV